MSLRRYRIKQDEYAKVLDWLRRRGKEAKATDEDEKSAQPLEEAGFRMPADWLPKITWAHKVNMRIKKGAHGKDQVQVLEKEVWKTLVHEMQIDAYLRDKLLSTSADVPMSRDAGYHITQKRTVGISRRAFMKFLRKQEVLQLTRDALPEKKGVGRPPEARGNLEIDLVEAKGKDIQKYVGHPVKNFYWITLIDRLTGWLEVKQILQKDFKTVVPAIRKMIPKMEKALRTKIKYIRSDSGSEFKSETKLMLEELKIKHRFVKSGNRLEQANKTFQKIWYRLMRLGRGDLKELDAQAQAIFNNTLSKVNGSTPLEAIEKADAELLERVREFKKKQKGARYKGAGPLQKGDKVRILLDSVRGKHGAELGYKSYRGKHWSEQVYTVVNFNKHRDAYYVASKYRSRDKLLHVPGVDALTNAAVSKRRARYRTGSVAQGAAAAGFEW